MANMSVENLSRIVQGGNIEELYGGMSSINPGGAEGGGEGDVGSTAAMELQTAQEMAAQGVPQSTAPAGTTFSDVLRSSVAKVNDMQVQADTAIKELVAGRSKNIHETMLAVERADTSLKLMMQVRNKVLDAYREIMRMQV